MLVCFHQIGSPNAFYNHIRGRVGQSAIFDNAYCRISRDGTKFGEIKVAVKQGAHCLLLLNRRPMMTVLLIAKFSVFISELAALQIRV